MIASCKWLGLDLAALGLVSSLPEVSVKGARQLSDTTKSAELINRGEVFNPSSAASILRNTRWIGSRITASDDIGTILDGTVADGVVSAGVFSVTVQSMFRRYFNAILDESAYGADPAAAILALARSAGVPDAVLDLASFSAASRDLSASGIICNAACSKQFNVTLLSAINSLLDVGSLYAWLDDKLHVAHIPAAFPSGTTFAQRITSREQIGDIQAGVLSDRAGKYSLGYLGDSSGAIPAEGGTNSEDATTWSEMFNASSSYQLLSAQAAHAAGRLRLAQDARRRTATVKVRADGSVPIIMAGVYALDSAEWGGNPGWLYGKSRKAGIFTLDFLEVV